MLTTLLAAVEPTPGTLDVLEQVHGFYNDAWAQLMGVLIIAVAVVGVLVPVLILIGENHLARRREASFRLDTERVMTEIQNDRREMSEALEATRENLDRKIEEGRKAFADDQDRAVKRLKAAEVRLRWVWRNLSWQISLTCRDRGHVGSALGFACESVSADIEAGLTGGKPTEVRLDWIINAATSGKVVLKELARSQIRGAIDDLENSGMGGKYEECAKALKGLLEEAPPSEDHETEDESEDDSSTA